jgi:DNA-binding NtrC family response regulator
MNFERDAISGEEGFNWLKEILKSDPEAIVIFMTAYADTEKAVKAIKAGATDFISKPWEKQKLLATLSSAIKLRDSQQEVKKLKEQMKVLNEQRENMPLMIGKSPVMLEVFNSIQKIADADANILILGENGTGKDLVARVIRYYSSRNQNPFVTIDLGSIPENLFESELFGYEKGAFTDARTPKAGRMETASGGTLFLDEIGNLSLAMQSKLLTAIEKKEISRIGSTKTRPIDTRLICATNANIHQMVLDGSFRQDLLYRINTIEIHIPPLRERGEDIILLAEHFIERYAHKYKKDIKGITRDGKLKLKKYSWPGNVRELQHAIERAIILSDGGWLTPASFMLQPPAESKTGLEDILNLEKLKATAIEIAMKRAKGNVSQAAELLGITRYALYRYLEKTE